MTINKYPKEDLFIRPWKLSAMIQQTYLIEKQDTQDMINMAVIIGNKFIGNEINTYIQFNKTYIIFKVIYKDYFDPRHFHKL